MENATPFRAVRFGVFDLDLKAGELHKNGLKVRLQDQPFQILKMLLERPGEVVTHQEIIRRLWPNGTVVEYEHSIQTAVKKLRQALDDDAEAPRYVETLPRRGYRFIYPVNEAGVHRGVAQPPQAATETGSLPGMRRGSPDLVGKRVSRYRVLEMLGGGGMGVVYKAEDLRLGRFVALKFLPEELGNNRTALERFEREARAAAALNHPNICVVHDIDTSGEQPFIVMELLEGETLRERIVGGNPGSGAVAAGPLLRAGAPPSPGAMQVLPTGAPQGVPLQIATMLDTAIQISGGLEAAHDKGITHRDIKPANIFVTTRGQVKILDFGLAKLTPSPPSPLPAGEGRESVFPRPLGGEGASRDPVGTEPSIGAGERVPLHDTPTASIDPNALTNPGVAMGTVAYMSPEQARGEKLDARTDLFSFGAVLYEMATGQMAFTGATTAMIHDAILNRTPASPVQLNPDVPAELEGIISKALEKDRAVRYQSADEMLADLQRLKRELDSARAFVGSGLAPPGAKARESIVTPRPLAGEGAPSIGAAEGVRSGWRWALAAVAVALAATAGTYFYLHSRSPVKLTDKDTIVLADFTNSTGDAVFDDTLKQALRVQLEQSPFLDVLSDEKASQELGYMGRSRDARLTKDVAREVCQRTGSKAMLAGSIASLGSHYVLGLTVLNCESGDSFASDQVEAESREKVLGALGQAATKMRAKLGESLASIQRYDAPTEQVTTSSLEALQAYSLGLKTWSTNEAEAAIPFFKRATELDPNFAMAYFQLGAAYLDHGQFTLGREAAKKAYELREGVSEREKLNIENDYYSSVTGELEKAAQVWELWKQTYPRDSLPYGNLRYIYKALGQYEKALAEDREAVRVEPNDGGHYLSLAGDYLALGRPALVKELLTQAQTHKLNYNGWVILFFYKLAFLRGDVGEMERQVQAAVGRPGGEFLLLGTQAETEAYHGRLAKARDFSRQAAASAIQSDNREAAEDYKAVAALREAEFGNASQAKKQAAAALALTPAADQEPQTLAALALARAGDSARALAAADDLNRRRPLDTLLNGYWLPTIHAAVEVRRANPSRALELLRPVTPYELSDPYEPGAKLCPSYVRGEAYLALHQGSQAATEFQRILDHPGIVRNAPVGALAHLGLGRAYALQAGVGAGLVPAQTGRPQGAPLQPEVLAKARKAYEDFFALWKDADSDIPILKQAKAEYARLR